ncbi:MAG: SRPBCC domain-containing protein [Actinobacteria bacterium]|nr:SRPBCC domain-containing protein [Actinomycetota bacterium]
MRRIVLLAGVLALVVVLAGATLAASAKLDRPSTTKAVEQVIDASRKTVWNALIDLDAYDEWNPYVTRARGEIVIGSDLELVLSPPGEELREATVELLTATGRKLRWEDRLLLPGLRDQEVTFRVFEVSDERSRLVVAVRSEGLLSPWADLEPTRRGLERMAAALARRVEG